MVEQEDWAGLEEKGKELLLSFPQEHEAIELTAYSLQQGLCLEAAANIAMKASDLYPSFWIFHFLAGVCLKGIGQKEEACKQLWQAANITPCDSQTIRCLFETIAALDGVEVAASEYVLHSEKHSTQTNIVVAPISTVLDWTEKNGQEVLDAGTVEKIPFKAPHVWGNPPASETLYALSNKPYVAKIENVRIFSNSSIILTADGVALSDTAGHPRFGSLVSLAYEQTIIAKEPGKVLMDLTSFKERKIDAGIYLSGLASSAFGHWLPDFLPKLQFLQQHPEFANLPIIVDAGMPQSHFDHLKRLVNNPLIILEANESFLCKSLLVAPSPAFFPVDELSSDIPVHDFPGLSPRALQFLRGNELNEYQGTGDKRIFLARKNMKWRRLLNEEEIATDLQKLGFEIIYTEEMSVDEQIKLFRQAQWIVAPNGSALLNLIFSSTSSKLLVLIQPNLFNWGTFQGPMDALGYQSLCVSGDYDQHVEQKHSNYHVPVERIRAALAYLGLNTEPS
jgi:hypothetical protein